MTEQPVDFKLIPAGELYSPLCNLELFNGVQINTEVGTLVWAQKVRTLVLPRCTIGRLIGRRTKSSLDDGSSWSLAGAEGRSTILEL